MPTFMYVARQEDDKISIFHVDQQTGRLTPQAEVAAPGGPAPLAMDPAKNVLYAGRRGAHEISSFKVDHASGGLSLMGTVSLVGEPCFLSTDRKGNYLFSSYYQAGKAAVHPINSEGVASGPPIELLDTAIGAHSFQTDPSNKFAFVPHIAGRGPNAIFQFRFDEATGKLTPNTPPRFSPQEQLGPRHFCFHPAMDILYFSDEQGCSVSGYHLDTDSGTLSPFQTLSTLPPGYTGENSCAQIQITPSGRFLYAPNRGHNSIACFSIDPADGRLTSLGQVPTEPVPRAISLDPEGRFLYAAGLESGRLACYSIDSSSGQLSLLETIDVGNRPMWVLVAGFPG